MAMIESVIARSVARWDQAVRACSGIAASASSATRTERVHVSHHTRPTKPLHVQPVMLSTNLAELTSLLHSDGVKAHSQLFDANQDSMKTLTHFLKRYSKGLAADTPLRAQRHKLEFVLPNSGGETALRRVVCSIGTTGSTSGHNLVHRSMQALFREVGLTPNFVWDSDYAVPSMYLPYDQKRALEEARLDNTVEQIKRVQRGEKAQESATLKMMDPSDTAAARPPEAEVLASQLRGDEVDELAAAPPESESDVEVSSLEVQESIQKIAVELDEAVRTLAMSPWMMVASEARRLEEQKTLAELQVFVSGLLPKLMLAVAKVQEGERDADKLTEFVSEDPDDEGFAAAAVQQLLQCHGALERAAGAPDAEAPKTRHAMVRTIKRVKCVQEWNEARMRGGR